MRLFALGRQGNSTWFSRYSDVYACCHQEGGKDAQPLKANLITLLEEIVTRYFDHLRDFQSSEAVAQVELYNALFTHFCKATALLQNACEYLNRWNTQAKHAPSMIALMQHHERM